MAVYREGKWHCGDRVFTVIECEVPTMVEFEDDATWRPVSRGPFEALRIVNATLRYGPGFKKVLAEFDEASECWCIHPEREFYSTILLVPPRPDPVPAGQTAHQGSQWCLTRGEEAAESRVRILRGPFGSDL
jgi:hypothetical protein